MDLKVHIIKAISRTNHQKCYQELKKRFDSETELDARLAYIEALSEIGNPEIIPVLVKLSGEDNLWEERRAAIKALGVLKAEAARKFLLGLLKAKDPIISREALSALGNILTPEEFKKTGKGFRHSKKATRNLPESFQRRHEANARWRNARGRKTVKRSN